MAHRYEQEGERLLRGGIAGCEEIGFVAAAAEFGIGDTFSLLRETDEDALLAAQAAIRAAVDVRREQYEALAQHIVAQLAKAMKK